MKMIDTENLNRVPPDRTAREEILRAASNQRSLATTFEELLGDGGPTNETADEMIRTIREWRDFPIARSL